MRQLEARKTHVVPFVVKVIKNLLLCTGLNTPFNGGLSSYSVFLMVCAAYESCDLEDIHNESVGAGTGTVTGVVVDDGSLPLPVTTASAPILSSSKRGVSPASITEGRLFLHVLKLFGRDFDPEEQGIGEYALHKFFCVLIYSYDSSFRHTWQLPSILQSQLGTKSNTGNKLLDPRSA